MSKPVPGATVVVTAPVTGFVEAMRLLVSYPLKVNAPCPLGLESRLFCCRRKLTPHDMVCIPWIHIRVPVREEVWARMREADPSDKPAKSVKLRLGGPQFSGSVETPWIPSREATLVRLAKYGDASARLRLKT